MREWIKHAMKTSLDAHFNEELEKFTATQEQLARFNQEQLARFNVDTFRKDKPKKDDRIQLLENAIKRIKGAL